MGTISYTVPTAGSDLNSVADAEVSTALTTLKTWANGNIDAVNLSNTLAASACVNESGQTVKGAVSISASESTSSTSYTTLNTPDQVTGIVLPSNGLIRVWYWATWQESVAGGAAAAIFIGANQAKSYDAQSAAGPAGQWAIMGSSGTPANNTNHPLFTCASGLVSYDTQTSAYTGDVSTGQILGVVDTNSRVRGAFGGVTGLSVDYVVGGPCDIFAAAGTYTVSIQFKVSSGSLTASNRKLWVQALSFA